MLWASLPSSLLAQFCFSFFLHQIQKLDELQVPLSFSVRLRSSHLHFTSGGHSFPLILSIIQTWNILFFRNSLEKPPKHFCMYDFLKILGVLTSRLNTVCLGISFHHDLLILASLCASATVFKVLLSLWFFRHLYPLILLQTHWPSNFDTWLLTYFAPSQLQPLHI